MSESHGIKGGATDEECLLWERGNFDSFNFQELRSNTMEVKKKKGQ